MSLNLRKRPGLDGHTHDDTGAAIYHFIVVYKLAHGGAPPTYRDIMEGVGVASSSTVRYHLNRLVEAGLLALERNHRVKIIRVVGERYLPPEGWDG